MTRVEKTVVAIVLLILLALVFPATNNPPFMLAKPPPGFAGESGVLVFISDSKPNSDGSHLELQLTVLNRTGRRIYFRGESPGFGNISPYYVKEIAPNGKFENKPFHCGNGWTSRSLASGFGTTFSATLHPDERHGRYGFSFGFNHSGPYDEISWSEAFSYPD